MSNILSPIPHEVEFKALPTGVSDETKEFVTKERRAYSGELALLAARMDEERKSSSIDIVTGLPNLRALNETLPFIIAKAHEIGEPVAVMMIDVMGLKRANDEEGHATGDRLLRSVGGAFDGLLRDNDQVFRVGGDEFLAILLDYEPLPGETEEALNARYTARIREQFAASAAEARVPEIRNVGLSVGIATLRPEDDYTSIIERADQLELADHERIYAEKAAKGITFDDRRLQV